MNNPFITIGIVGSYYHSNIEYNVNTYIGQNISDYELIFSFDKRQCIPVSSIIDTLNASSFEIENRIRILEDGLNGGILHSIQEIIQAAKGDYIFFISIEDAFYDSEVLKNVQRSVISNPGKINMFKTLLHIGEQWIDVSVEEGKKASTSICYPIAYLKQLTFDQPHICNNFVQVQELLKAKLKPEITDAKFFDVNAVVHCSDCSKNSLTDYYFPENQININIQDVLAQMSDGIKLSDLTASELTQIYSLLLKKERGEPVAADIETEIYTMKYLANTSLWGQPRSHKPYLEVLQYIYHSLNKTAVNNYKLKILKYKIICMRKHRKIKLAFFTNEYSVWPSLQSVYTTACSDPSFDVKLVYIPFFHEFSSVNHAAEMMKYLTNKYSIIASDEYDLLTEEPDIVFYVNPYDSIPEKFRVQEIRKLAAKIVYIPYGMEIGMAKENLYYQCYSNMQWYADYVLAYSPLYYEKMQKYTYTKGRNYLTIGHPRIDLSQTMKDTSYKKIVMEKAQERKIVFWNTHFSIEDGDNWGTFLKYGESIIDYFKTNPDLFLLWRPHPLFYSALASFRNESLTETKKWLYKITDVENICIDESDTYLTAFQISDAMISDWNSFIPEYLCYKKPLLVTEKEGFSSALLSSAEPILPIARNRDDIFIFLKKVAAGKLQPLSDDTINNYLYLPKNETVATILLKCLKKDYD